jgi:hypothetical protein
VPLGVRSIHPIQQQRDIAKSRCGSSVHSRSGERHQVETSLDDDDESSCISVGSIRWMTPQHVLDVKSKKASFDSPLMTANLKALLGFWGHGSTFIL